MRFCGFDGFSLAYGCVVLVWIRLDWIRVDRMEGWMDGWMDK